MVLIFVRLTFILPSPFSFSQESIPSCLSRIYLLEQCILYVIVYVHVCTRLYTGHYIESLCTRLYTGHHIESCMYTWVHGASYRIVYVHVCTRDIISNPVCTRRYTGHHIESCMYTANDTKLWITYIWYQIVNFLV